MGRIKDLFRRDFGEGLRKKLIYGGVAGVLLFGGCHKTNGEKVEIRPDEAYKTSDFSSDSDEVLLARMLFGEARNCSDLEKIAIGYTAINRANDGKKWNGETVKEAILKPNQYSCFNDGDPNKEKLMNPYVDDKEAFDKCLIVASNMLKDKYDDKNTGATHYYNPSGCKEPAWASKMIKIGKIDVGDGKVSKHIFMRER